MGGVYKEQEELDPLPTITNPSLLATKASKPISRKDKKLIVLHNFTSLEKYGFIMREIKDASTDIIVVSNELFCEEKIAKEFDKCFNRGCNIIEVTNLQPISIMQRMVYGLLEKNSFIARDADHIVFTLLSEYSRGAATIVHLLTSLMQKSDDNSRTGFELAKQQLKLHIAHRKLERMSDNYITKNTLNEASMKLEERGGNVMTKRELQKARTSSDYSPRDLEQPGETFVPEVTPSCMDNNKLDDVSGSQNYKTSFQSMQVQTKISEDNVSTISEDNVSTSSVPHVISSRKTTAVSGSSPISIIPECYRPVSSSSEPSSVQTEESILSTNQPSATHAYAKNMDDGQTMISSFITTIANFVASGGDDDTQTAPSNVSQPSTTAKPEKHILMSAKKHPLYLFINDLLSTISNISLPAHHLLGSLAITGPIPLPMFYVEELDNVVMNAVFIKEEKRIQTESPMKQLIKEGVIRKSCYPILYHKDLNTDFIDLSIQQMFVAKLICDAVKDEMNDIDEALAILSAQRALENLLTNESKLSLINLHYILVICNELDNVCRQDLYKRNDELLTTSLKLKLQISQKQKHFNKS